MSNYSSEQEFSVPNFYENSSVSKDEKNINFVIREDKIDLVSDQLIKDMKEECHPDNRDTEEKNKYHFENFLDFKKFVTNKSKVRVRPLNLRPCVYEATSDFNKGTQTGKIKGIGVSA